MRAKLDKQPARVAWLIAAALIMAMVGIGCGGDDDGGGGEEGALQEVGEPEGELNLIAWPGYVADPWQSDFEKETGCQIKLREAGTSDEMVDQMRTGQWDGVSASGNASLRLVAGGDVDPVNLDLVPSYETVFEDLKDQPYNTVDGVNYGVPHGRGANLLMWNANAVKPDPTSWGVILDPSQASKYKGEISVYDDSVYIADAALYLKAHNPELGIDNPYELDEEQFNAAVDLLKEQQPNVGEYWVDAAKQIQSFANEDVVVGTTWQYQYFALQAEDAPVAVESCRRLPPGGGCDGVVRHLDDLVRGGSSQLHVPVDGSHRLSAGKRRGRAVLRRGAGPEQVVRTRDTREGRQGPRVPARPEVLRQLPRRGPGFLGERLLLDHSGGGLRR